MLEDRHFILIVAAIFVGIAGSMDGQDLAEPAGEQFLVNTYSHFQQRFPAVAMGPDGYVVVWTSFEFYFGARNDMSVRAQRFSSTGIRLGEEFQVNTYTTVTSRYLDVAAAPDGSFMVVWNGLGSPGIDPGKSILGQLFDSDGLPTGVNFQVNTYWTSVQKEPKVASTELGSFLVVWESEQGNVDADWSVQGQRLASDGSALGEQFRLNSVTVGEQREPSLSMAPDGSFVAVWETSAKVRGRRFDSGGDPLSEEFEVGDGVLTTPAGLPSQLAVASQPSGAFVVAFTQQLSGSGDPGAGIRGYLFDSLGTPVGDGFRVNTYTPGDQENPTLAVESDGGFQVFWDSQSDVLSQRFAVDGTPLGGELVVNTYTTGNQQNPAVAIDSENNFVVVWESSNSWVGDPFSFSIQGQLYRVDAVLSDGFESGDTSNWTQTVP